jgi:uncharacterized SAM-binding protein YcdF (DUF218 family)
MPGQYKDTAEEVSAIFLYARQRNFNSIILLTSDYHARRVRLLIGKKNDDSIQTNVLTTPYQALMQDRQWMKRGTARRLVLSEFLKVLYLRLSQ